MAPAPFSSLALAALALALALRGARGSLPATVSATVFVPGDHVPSVQIPTLAGSSVDPADARVQPLLIVSLDASDPFFRFSTSDENSLRDFLLLGPDGNAHFLFSAWGGGSGGSGGSEGPAARLRRLRARIGARLQALPATVASKWAGRLLYTNGTAEAALGPEIAGALTQWGSPRNTITVGSGPEAVSVPRLDCRYTFCPWPSQNQALSITMADHPCAPQKYNFSAGPTAVLVLLDSGAADFDVLNCTAEQAASANIAAGAAGVVVAPATAGGLVYPIGVRAGAGNQGLAKWATMVSFEDGAKLAKTLVSGLAVQGAFSTKTGPGQALAIDAQGTLQQVGWEKYATLRQIGWEARWLGYAADVANRVAEPAFIIPVFNQARTGTTSANLFLPTEPQLAAFSVEKAELDFSLECPSGNMDGACSVWDRIVSVTAVCGKEPPMEIGRWINAFQRRGHWLTATPLLAGLLGRSCAFTFNVDLNNPWRATLSLRFPLATAAAGANHLRAFHAEPIVYPNPSINFNSPSYNLNKTVSFTPPKGTRKVEVAALITGHSGCEFVSTEHTFTVNAKGPGHSTSEAAYRERYMQAGTDLGCANQVRNGSVPNEHGTWYFGRNGWCDGMDVKPVVFDISADISGVAAANTLTYTALAFPNGARSNGTDKGCGGYIQQSSYLIYYK